MKLVIWGAGGHALVVSDILRAAGEHECVGFLVDAEALSFVHDNLRDSVLGGREQLDSLRRAGVHHGIVAVGDCFVRLEIAEMLCAKGFSLATAVHPRAVIAQDARIGQGCVVAANAVIGPAAILGENVIVNTAATVDHECILEDGAHISPGAHLAGRVRVGRATWVGIGAIVIEGIRIGDGSLLGAGAVAVDDIPDNVMAYGVPARIVRNNQPYGR